VDANNLRTWSKWPVYYRSTPTLSPGELQRLRLATQLHSNLFGVVYVLDEPSAGLHPADTEALLDALETLKRQETHCLW
jgi:excinuclease ABC subunit A